MFVCVCVFFLNYIDSNSILRRILSIDKYWNFSGTIKYKLMNFNNDMATVETKVHLMNEANKMRFVILFFYFIKTLRKVCYIFIQLPEIGLNESQYDAGVVAFFTPRQKARCHTLNQKFFTQFYLLIDILTWVIWFFLCSSFSFSFVYCMLAIDQCKTCFVCVCLCSPFNEKNIENSIFTNFMV